MTLFSLEKNLLSDIGHVGEKQCGYDTRVDYEINNGDKFFRAKEVEIYQITFNDLTYYFWFSNSFFINWEIAK